MRFWIYFGGICLLFSQTQCMQNQVARAEANLSQSRQTLGPEKGTLVIVGGGGLGDIFDQFMELAGGMDAKLVVIPTANGSSDLGSPASIERYEAFFANLGATNVTLLHTRDPKEADTDEFVAPLKKAEAVWIPGGRQWRLVDSYMNTKTLTELYAVLNRGGVIGGSSAGATIQGSYLARGDTKSNLIMMGDHEEGFGFISNIAIDQHVLARNRQFDLFEILDEHPHLLGIGLDESTGIVVKGNEFEVIGKSYVAIYDGTMWQRDKGEPFDLDKGNRQFYFLAPGMKYNLKDRRIVQ